MTHTSYSGVLKIVRFNWPCYSFDTETMRDFCSTDSNSPLSDNHS
jgi:hypothetical protein